MSGGIKIVMVGAAATGKTSIVERYMYDRFNLHTIPSTQPAFAQKTVHRHGHDINLEIWDTAGQERYNALSPLFYRDAKASIVVFDLTDPDSFQRAIKWISDLRQARGNQIFIVLAGNKVDLETQRAVTSEEARKVANAQKIQYFETSAKTGSLIDDVFSSIADNFVNSAIIAGTTQSKSIKDTIQFGDEQKQDKTTCC